MKESEKFYHDLLKIIKKNDLTRYEFRTRILYIATSMCWNLYKESENELKKQALKTMKEIDKLIELRKPF